jgi:hypothetical protein
MKSWSHHQANIVSHTRLIAMGDAYIANELHMLSEKDNTSSWVENVVPLV